MTKPKLQTICKLNKSIYNCQCQKEMINNKKNKILVTGSAGFIASHLVDYLISLGNEVWGVDDFSGGFLRNISPEARSTFIKLDLRNKKKTSDVVKKIKPKIVYHLAAIAREGLSQFSPISHTENNYNAYLNLLIPSIKSGVKRMVVCSSMAVYGNQKPPFSEDMRREPFDIYGVAKTAMEQSTEILADVYNFEYVILRPHNVYGPRQNMADPYRNVVAIFINSLLKNKQFYIYGNGEQKRSFSYIDDITPSIAKSGFLKKANKQIINVGPEKEYTINQLAKIILKAFDSKIKPIYLADRPREVKEAYCSAQKAKEMLGFKDKTSLTEGIEKMVKWAKTVGYTKPLYLKDLELENEQTPKTWSKKLI